MKHSSGFTLVEVLVALVVLSLIMVTTISGFRTLANTSASIRLMTERTDELRSVSTFLRDAIENSVLNQGEGQSEGLSFGGAGASSEPITFFEKKGNSLVWRSKILFGEAYGGSYFLRLAQQGDELILQWQEPQSQRKPRDWRGSPARRVLSKLEEFEIWTRESHQDPWVTENREGSLPSHVRLIIKANGRYWPDLIMKVTP